ncbi:hypothetical protein ACFQ0X_33675 [Streptomyces rectiviolaceus]|uniref:Uncharacterized protein n=1 Tax=Streptomyces rectiviolaceus TaxID=332591 RepID=A0ABP6MGX1_9ACTN
MYEYKDSRFVLTETEHWVAWPVRPRWQVVLGFVAMVAYVPLWCVLAVVVMAGVIVVLFLAEIVESVSDSGERKLNALSDRMLDRLLLPDWCVTWPELRHEGDTAYYRARVDKFLDGRTKLASAPRTPKTQPPVECELPWRVYRGVGGDYVVKAAAAQGWELRPSEPEKSIRLWWSAATRAEAGTGTAE